MTMFGAAYLGYVGGLFDERFEAGFPAWLWETNEAMLLEYPFIAEIDEEHIIGGAGHLYCIVPVDEDATVAINRVQWNEKTQTDEVTEVLYRSESGEPVLLFANLDGVAYEADTQVFITDNNGNTCEWEPSLDATSHLAPCISEAGDYLSFDFTEYAWYNAPAEFSAWLADGWSGMTALGLAGSQRDGMGWITETMVGETSRYAHFSLRFYPEDETGGTVDLNWAYEGSDDFTEMWSGFWALQTIPDGPSYVTLSLSLVGGKNYGVTDGPMYLCETYPLLISPSGTELLVGAGESGICLPFIVRIHPVEELWASARKHDPQKAIRSLRMVGNTLNDFTVIQPIPTEPIFFLPSGTEHMILSLCPDHRTIPNIVVLHLECYNRIPGMKREARHIKVLP